MKLDAYIADRRINLAEARAIEKEARAKGVADGAPLQITEGAAQAVSSVLSNNDVFIEPDARAVLEALSTAPVVARPAEPAKRGKLFKTDEPLKLKIAANFTDLFANKMGTGRTPGGAGTLEFGEGADARKIPINVRTRGQSSLSSLPEPKLKIKLDKAAREGTDFEKEGSLEIGVQGGASGKDALGRVLIPEAPAREAATYALLEEMGLAVPRARVAHIDYVDANGTVRSQPAFLTEDADSVAKRFLGDKGIEVGNYGNNDQRPDLQATFQSKDLLRLHLGLLLVGNRDWNFSANGDTTKPTIVSSVSMHNTKMVFRPDPVNANQGEGLPVATDFDLSLFVLQDEFAGYMKNAMSPVDYPREIQQLRAAYGPQATEVLADLVAREGKMNERLAGYPLDDASKAFIKGRLDQFFAAVKAELPPAAPVAPAAPVQPLPV
jgi:hypothetical protein